MVQTHPRLLTHSERNREREKNILEKTEIRLIPAQDSYPEIMWNLKDNLYYEIMWNSKGNLHYEIVE